VITRNEIYGKEAAEILRVVSVYKTLDERQIYALFPQKPDAIKTLLSRFVKQRRLFYRFNKGNKRYSIDTASANKPDFGTISAFWVLLDFIDKTEYHTSGDFPVKINFLAKDEIYEIIYIKSGKENLINRILSETANDDSRRIVLVDTAEQIPKINIPNTAGYCSVEQGGAVKYYKIKQEG
jgi:hypothetical protein